MLGNKNGTSEVSTTRTSFEILALIRDAGGATIADIRAETDLAKSTVYRHLKTLHDMNYLVEEGGEYRLSLRFLQLSEPPRIRRPGYLVAKQKVIELAIETDERALFLVEEGFEGVYLHRAGGRNPLQSDTMIGKRRPLHALASGKAILAEWSDERIEEFVETAGLNRLTANTITDRDALVEELEQVREQGYATNMSEHMDGLRAAGVPVYNHEDDLIGALSVFGPSGRVRRADIESTYPDLLEQKASELKIDLTYD
ncbi:MULTISPECIES: IclR family transcriptional regulator [unclassified Haloarcula]|uniref:IclR family transcriptional regulator n=1 Tax=Haloarcula TaxID=2237 RepID=UPI000EF1711C|nr:MULTISPECIES: IclR family transcriptional regulator [unclassified Haloarcula]RLM39580.1 IclR family transcriptional regulator [Haloarcula sp. Atlit-120R]RLM47554.1 IclR family transcriptional regulator [Haloarcula sp. Atlit-47R]RLM97236.1 IclR family transcriptional regulator [Haloarcula sp. Atlit-7R]